jgi:hypothetical protein
MTYTMTHWRGAIGVGSAAMCLFGININSGVSLMRTFAFAGLVAVAALAFAGCANNKGTDANMGATSGQCAGKDGKCCGSCKGDKGAMGAVSGEKSCASKSSCGGK